MINYACQPCIVDYKQFRVETNAPAIALLYIFAGFFRIRSDDIKDKESNGLGLAIVKSIVEQHQGTISVDSEPREGFCFTIALPLVQQGPLDILNSKTNL